MGQVCIVMANLSTSSIVSDLDAKYWLRAPVKRLIQLLMTVFSDASSFSM
jgi:hypothetical protein